MHDLTRLKVHVEDVLRHNVADNYRIFMHATREIQRMGAEIAELKEAVNDTSAVVANLSTMKLNTTSQISLVDQSPPESVQSPNIRDSISQNLLNSAASK